MTDDEINEVVEQLTELRDWLRALMYKPADQVDRERTLLVDRLTITINRWKFSKERTET